MHEHACATRKSTDGMETHHMVKLMSAAEFLTLSACTRCCQISCGCLVDLDSQDVEEVAQWIAALDTTGLPGANTNVFECTIRVVGGLLSAAHLLDGDKRLLRPAVEVALRLLIAFNSKSGIPYSDVDLKSITARQPAWTAFSSLSEATTLSLEFCHVARVCIWPTLHLLLLRRK